MKKFNLIIVVCVILFLACLANKLTNKNRTTNGYAPTPAFQDYGIMNEKIVLPEAAHNTIGQIPLVEHFDDGDLGGKRGEYFPLFMGVTTTCVSFDTIFIERRRR